MAFLDLTTSTGTTSFVQAEPMGQGTHAVTLTRLAYVATADKILAVFVNQKGEEFTEWLGSASDGAKLRTKMFLVHMMNLSGVSRSLSFESMADLDAFGKQIVAAMPTLNLTLAPDEYQGKIRFVLATKHFDECITLANAPAATDDSDLPF